MSWVIRNMDKKPTRIVNAHDHSHSVNRFAVIPTADRLNADPALAVEASLSLFLILDFIDTPILSNPATASWLFTISAVKRLKLMSDRLIESWHWHGTQTTVAAAGNGQLCDGKYRGIASDARLVLVKVSKNGRISEENIAQGTSLGYQKPRTLQHSRTEHFARR